MDWSFAQPRFSFAAEALDGCGGFVPSVKAPGYLVRHPRETDTNFEARAKLAGMTYENHFRRTVRRFTGFLSRRRPIRDGADTPLAELLVNDADQRGTPLDLFWRGFALQAKARGSMLLLIDLPMQITATTAADQIAARAVPYLRAIKPEAVSQYQIDANTGRFTSVSVRAPFQADDGRTIPDAVYTWTDTEWLVTRGEDVLAQGEHPFGECPVLAFTEDGEPFPSVGDYTQIAHLGTRLWNARSESDTILRSCTFPVLTFQIPENLTFDQNEASAVIGSHSMLVHRGIVPSFIAPPNGPSEVYLQMSIPDLRQAIALIAKDQSTADSSSAAESGVSRRMRFEALNSELADFAAQMQSLEQRMWTLFHRALNAENRVTVEWPTDFNLVDTAAELDILALMQATGFPERAQVEKRLAIAGAEFDGLDQDTRAKIAAAISEQAQEQPPKTTGAM